MCGLVAGAEKITGGGLSRLPHRFLARDWDGRGVSAHLGDSIAAAAVAWSGSSDTDRRWRPAATFVANWSCGARLGLGLALGRSCTLGDRRFPIAPPVPLPRLRNGLGVAQSPRSPPTLFRLLCDCDLATGAALLTVLLLGSDSSPCSFFGVAATDTPDGTALLTCGVSRAAHLTVSGLGLPPVRVPPLGLGCCWLLAAAATDTRLASRRRM